MSDGRGATLSMGQGAGRRVWTALWYWWGRGESPTTKRSNAGDEMIMREWKQIGAV